MDLQRASWWSSWWLRISNFVWLGVGAWEYHVILIAIIVARGDQHWWAMLHDPDGRMLPHKGVPAYSKTRTVGHTFSVD